VRLSPRMEGGLEHGPCRLLYAPPPREWFDWAHRTLGRSRGQRPPVCTVSGEKRLTSSTEDQRGIDGRDLIGNGLVGDCGKVRKEKGKRGEGEGGGWKKPFCFLQGVWCWHWSRGCGLPCFCTFRLFWREGGGPSWSVHPAGGVVCSRGVQRGVASSGCGPGLRADRDFCQSEMYGGGWMLAVETTNTSRGDGLATRGK